MREIYIFKVKLKILMKDAKCRNEEENFTFASYITKRNALGSKK